MWHGHVDRSDPFANIGNYTYFFIKIAKVEEHPTFMWVNVGSNLLDRGSNFAFKISPIRDGTIQSDPIRIEK